MKLIDPLNSYTSIISVQRVDQVQLRPTAFSNQQFVLLKPVYLLATDRYSSFLFLIAIIVIFVFYCYINLANYIPCFCISARNGQDTL